MATIDGDASSNILNGTTGTDLIRGIAGDDELHGDEARDRLQGGEGADILDGGDGATDSVEYQVSSAGVIVNLTTGTGLSGDAQSEFLSNIERIIGSNYIDILTGDEKNNLLNDQNSTDELYGLDGNDTLYGGNGADQLFGGAGIDRLEDGAGAGLIDGGDGTKDTADYRRSNVTVNINLEAATAFGGHADGGTLVNIERLVGPNHGDTLTGDSGKNVLSGLEGDNILSGAGGIDTIIGGLGDDTLTRGNGYDLYLMQSAFGLDTIIDFEAGAGMTDRLFFRGLGLIQSDLTLTDTAAGAEIVAGTYGTLLLEGVNVADLATDDFIF